MIKNEGPEAGGSQWPGRDQEETRPLASPLCPPPAKHLPLATLCVLIPDNSPWGGTGSPPALPRLQHRLQFCSGHDTSKGKERVIRELKLGAQGCSCHKEAKEKTPDRGDSGTA